MSTRYRVHGMTCNGCAQSVIRAIQSVAAGATVTVDLEEKTVIVSDFDDEATIAQAVEAAGFDFRGRQPHPIVP